MLLLSSILCVDVTGAVVVAVSVVVVVVVVVVAVAFLKRPLSQPGAGLAASQGGPMKAGVHASRLQRPLSQPGASPAASQGAPAARGKWPLRRGRE